MNELMRGVRPYHGDATGRRGAAIEVLWTSVERARALQTETYVHVVGRRGTTWDDVGVC